MADTTDDRFSGVPCSDLSFSNADWTEFIAPFVDGLISLYPNDAALIRANAAEDTGPRLEDYDAYGRRVDTGLRVRGQVVWRYVKNGKHVCMIQPGGHHAFTWALDDPDLPRQGA
jgi:hypothetical protein